MPELIDRHGRRMRKLRVSLLDGCNFRCLYCMPADQKFMPRADWLRVDELIDITRSLVGFGLEQVRVTGGEPLLRPEFAQIMERLSALPLKKLALTTNGFALVKHLDLLERVGCRHLNISIDSLSEEKFARITRSRHFADVIEAILAAKARGFNVKLNAVLMRGINDDEVFDFAAFSARHDVEIRFLELMKIGQARTLGTNAFISAGEVITRLRERTALVAEPVDFDSTSFNYETSEGARLGFIASESRPFCATCSRLRLSANGTLRACLMAESGTVLKGLSAPDLHAALINSLNLKPMTRAPETSVDMNRLGG